MGNFNAALERLIEGFEGFTEQLRNMADNQANEAGDIAGAGEELEDIAADLNPDGGYDNVVKLADAPRQGDLDDDTIIKMRSGDLRKVLDAYRKMTRWAREGYIPNQDERVKLHQYIRKVKHLVRRPRQHAA